jgi:hypothetical protein
LLRRLQRLFAAALRDHEPMRHLLHRLVRGESAIEDRACAKPATLTG